MNEWVNEWTVSLAHDDEDDVAQRSKCKREKTKYNKYVCVCIWDHNNKDWDREIAEI